MEAMELRKSYKSSIALLLLASMFILAGASMTRAYETYTTECGPACHSSATITVTSNATGTVNATVNKPFILNIDAVGYTGNDFRFYIRIESDSGWADNDKFSFTEILVQDDGTNDTNANDNEISISVEFTPIEAGTHILRIWAAGSNAEGGSLDVTVLAEYDANAPIIDNPPDIEYEYQETGSVIVWNATDPNPVNYTIYRNGVIVGSGGWNGSMISIGVDWLIPGTYEYTLTVFNIGGYSSSDTVIVTVTLPGVTTTSTTTTTTTDTTTTTTGSTTSEPTETTSTSQGVPTGPLILPGVVEPLALVVGTWVAIIVVVLLISEILIRKGRW